MGIVHLEPTRKRIILTGGGNIWPGFWIFRKCGLAKRTRQQVFQARKHEHSICPSPTIYERLLMWELLNFPIDLGADGTFSPGVGLLAFQDHEVFVGPGCHHHSKQACIFQLFLVGARLLPVIVRVSPGSSDTDWLLGFASEPREQIACQYAKNISHWPSCRCSRFYSICTHPLAPNTNAILLMADGKQINS